jgi:AcrR family transcriptional regulator
MGPKARREREKLDLRQTILEAARELFLQEGDAGLSMRKVADKIQYSATTLYNYFDDKESMIRAIIEADFLSLRRGFDQVAMLSDPIERLAALGAAYVDFAVEHPSSYRFLFMTMHAPRDPKTMSIEHGNPDEDAYAFLRATIADGIEAGRFREDLTNADFLAQMFWAGCHGVVSIHFVKCHDPWLNLQPLKDTSRAVFEALLKGVLRDSNFHT